MQVAYHVTIDTRPHGVRNQRFDLVLRAVGRGLLALARGRSFPVRAGIGAGVALGAGVGLLMAPMSGRALRAKLSNLMGPS